jgi:3D (Asp-Asp-Asp) domain-containing protein
MSKSGANLKPMSRLRIVFILAGFLCIFHFGHRECAEGIPGSVEADIFAAEAPLPKAQSDTFQEFQATAYCLTGITKSGFPAAPGIVAADPDVLPLGSIIYVESPLMGGIYHVLDTGALIKGQIIDFFIPEYEKCVEFGRRNIKVKILQRGFPNKSIAGSEQTGNSINPPQQEPSYIN